MFGLWQETATALIQFVDHAVVFSVNGGNGFRPYSGDDCGRSLAVRCRSRYAWAVTTREDNETALNI